MIEEDVMIARWGLAAMLLFALLLTAAFLRCLHGQDIHPFEPILKFLRRPIGEVLIVLVCVGGLVQYGATKGFFGSPRMMAPREMQTELASAPESGDTVAGMFPSYTNAVTNVCATGIMPAETSVFLRAHWPWNLHPAPTGVEVYAAPRLSTNAWVGVGTAPIPGGDNSAVIELPYSVLPDGWMSSTFFRLGLDVDTDRDGLSDAFESIVSRTDPNLADTDGDGMPDGWEVANALNPRLADGVCDADSDGLSNSLEWQNGTDPLNEDTDNDGLVDSREVASVDWENGAVPWFDIVPLKVVEASGDQDRTLYGCSIPFVSRLAGGLVEVAAADVNGVVYFGNGMTTNGLFSSDSGSNLAYATGKHCAIVAGYWSNLRMRAALGSRISFGTALHDGATHFVVQYENVGTYSGGASNRVSFQVSICESTPDVVSVRYGNVTDDRNGYYLTIGAQGGVDDNRDNYPRLSFFYGSSSYPIMSGTTVVYRFGCGGDPHEIDTDGDGLADAEEVSAGTNPRKADSDGDGLDDGWEIEYGLDPLSAEGRDGAGGDFDNDGIENLREYDTRTNPASADTDGDGLSDGEEMGFITAGNAIPWLSLDESEDVTLPLLEEYRNRCSLNWTLPTPLQVQGETVTNLTLTSRGWLFFNRAGYANPGHSTGMAKLKYCVDRDALSLAVCGDGSLLVSTNLADRSTSVRVGTATHQGVGYAVVECVNMYRDQPGSRTNSVSWQVAVPTNAAEHVHVRYRDVTGEYMDGRNATIGMQSFGGKWICAYCEGERGRLHEDLALGFHLGRNSNPNEGDTDGDGLSDSQEATLGTNLNSSDTDGDGMPDGWEVQYDFNPCVAADADGDADNDGVDNLTESLLGSNPRSEDTDGDGLSDGEEREEGTSLTSVDTDCDGLEDAFELSIDTNPLQPDTDGDGMDDGWEWTYCRRARMPRLLAEGGRSPPDFDPAVNNNTDTDPANDFGADPDGDGLSNGEECENRTDPTTPDTDGDGVADGNEAGQNSDPSDATDGGRPNSRVAVQFTFGDPSGSHSEKYRLEITTVSGQGERPASFSWLNANYGECETRTARLKAGWKYEVRLTWAACNHASDGSYYPNYDYTLSMGEDIPKNVVLDDPGSIFRSDYYGGEYYGASHFPVLDSVATITVYEVTKVTVCKPEDQSWEELADSRVVLDDEELRIKVEIAPQVNSLAQCRQMFGDALIVKTSGTCPSGVAVPIGDDATMDNLAGKSEIRISKTRQQLISLGLLPARNEDGIDEMASYDVGTLGGDEGSDLTDCFAFEQIALAYRGRASKEQSLTLDTNPPNSELSESFFKAAGSEVLSITYGGVQSAKRQVMNQADYFYYSGHGHHRSAMVDDFRPDVISGHWKKDLDCVIFAGCSVLDINDYNNNFLNPDGNWDPKDHASSPGKLWEVKGPKILLGYNYYAPQDLTHAPERIVRSWMNLRQSMGDVDAWMEANDNKNGRNACAIVKDSKYVYFKRTRHKFFSQRFSTYEKVEVRKERWND